MAEYQEFSKNVLPGFVILRAKETRFGTIVADAVSPRFKASGLPDLIYAEQFGGVRRLVEFDPKTGYVSCGVPVPEWDPREVPLAFSTPDPEPIRWSDYR